jgi:hypothetical protein
MRQRVIALPHLFVHELGKTVSKYALTADRQARMLALRGQDEPVTRTASQECTVLRHVRPTDWPSRDLYDTRDKLVDNPDDTCYHSAFHDSGRVREQLQCRNKAKSQTGPGVWRLPLNASLNSGTEVGRCEVSNGTTVR